MYIYIYICVYIYIYMCIYIYIYCEQCPKKCKTKGGLKLHHRKHSIDAIDKNNIHERHYVKEAIEKTCKKVLEEKLHPETVINEVEKYLDIIT